MKHIKNFENFQLNEISSALANKAYNKANKEVGSTDDNITSELKSRQRNKFASYVNPKLKNIAKNFGFGIQKSDNDTYLVKLGAAGQTAYISRDGVVSSSLDTSREDSNTLKKLQRIANFIKNDNTEENEL